MVNSNEIRTEPGQTGEWKFHHLPNGGVVIQWLDGSNRCMPISPPEPNRRWGEPLWEEPDEGVGSLQRAIRAASQSTNGKEADNG